LAIVRLVLRCLQNRRRRINTLSVPFVLLLAFCVFVFIIIAT